jgi:hypothetical protein
MIKKKEGNRHQIWRRINRCSREQIGWQSAPQDNCARPTSCGMRLGQEDVEGSRSSGIRECILLRPRRGGTSAASASHQRQPTTRDPASEGWEPPPSTGYHQSVRCVPAGARAATQAMRMKYSTCIFTLVTDPYDEEENMDHPQLAMMMPKSAPSARKTTCRRRDQCFQRAAALPTSAEVGASAESPGSCSSLGSCQHDPEAHPGTRAERVPPEPSVQLHVVRRVLARKGWPQTQR